MIIELVKEYFCAHPKQDIEHSPVVDSVTEQWLNPRGIPSALSSGGSPTEFVVYIKNAGL